MSEGPLSSLRVVELAGLGPAPFCGMVLADLGAEVIRVDRADQVTGDHSPATRHDLYNRGKRSIGVDLKQEAGVEVVLQMVGRSDVLIEGFRPGVAERLGVGPAQALARNAALVYGRMTGWGQEGPLAGAAGHDVDYIALSGVLDNIGTREMPLPPLNLVADFGGGGMLLAVGVLAAVTWARAGGTGQVVDAAMVDGSALLATSFHGFVAEGLWSIGRQSNLLDGGAPFYSVYETADGGHVAVGALEPHFFAALVDGLGLEVSELPAQGDRDGWPVMRREFERRFRQRPRAEWESVFWGSDACVAPVLSLDEARRHPHNVARGVFVDIEGVTQPGPAPRFSECPRMVPEGPCFPGRDTREILDWLGYSAGEIGKLEAAGAVA